MERWAANTLRTLGIILTAGFVLVTSLLLLLLSMCAAGGDYGGQKHPEQVPLFLGGALVVFVAGIWFIARMARGILRSLGESEPRTEGISGAQRDALSPAGSSVPIHLSPASRKAIDRLVLALGAQIAVSGLAWVFSQLRFWSAPRALAPHNWALTLAVPFVLYHLPYAILIYLLLKRPGRLAFTYALAVPSVMILQALFSLGVVSYYFVHQPQGLLLLFVPWAIHIAILVFAYQVIEQVGVPPEPSSLIVAAVLTFVFFSSIHIITPLLYRVI